MKHLEIYFLWCNRINVEGLLKLISSRLKNINSWENFISKKITDENPLKKISTKIFVEKLLRKIYFSGKSLSGKNPFQRKTSYREKLLTGKNLLQKNFLRGKTSYCEKPLTGKNLLRRKTSYWEKRLTEKHSFIGKYLSVENLFFVGKSISVENLSQSIYPEKIYFLILFCPAKRIWWLHQIDRVFTGQGEN